MSKKPGFRIWDSASLADSEKICLQIKENIEVMSQENRLETQYMPPSLVPTQYFYDIVACFDAMYNMLLERDLVMTGNLKSPTKRNNIH